MTPQECRDAAMAALDRAEAATNSAVREEELSTATVHALIGLLVHFVGPS